MFVRRHQYNLHRYLLTLAICVLTSACASQYQCKQPLTHHWVDLEQVKADVVKLSHDDMQGRKTNTSGAEFARSYIAKRFAQIGLTPWAALERDDYQQPFEYQYQFSDRTGINMVAVQLAKQSSARWRVVVAHYDHLGKRGSKVYNGADDNASGVSGLFAIAEHWANLPIAQEVNLMLVATDAEEIGLYGGYGIVEELTKQQVKPELMLNLDMIGQPPRSKSIYIEGDKNLEQFAELKWQLYQQNNLCVREQRSHKPALGLGRTNWLKASDHYPFHKAKVPWVYLGVPPHRHYHQLTDTADTINYEFLAATIETGLEILQVDQNQILPIE
ncbi:M28 family peptidase [Shewanella sp. WXL01]|uniref:M28 family peptidase n=1 Tax=Shewanella sp. WXL01 TaxID=2709721 RepID=UPI00143828C2|nr:M28 family peptidase [Shewanella sp. WXL01]NKF49120.1 M28 family peptidase [Shewanella sp. WXL01]